MGQQDVGAEVPGLNPFLSSGVKAQSLSLISLLSPSLEGPSQALLFTLLCNPPIVMSTVLLLL